MKNQKPINHRQSSLMKVSDVKKSGDRIFHYNMIKGKIAEVLIQQLFLRANYQVYKYGIENTVPGILESLRNNRSDVAQEI